MLRGIPLGFQKSLLSEARSARQTREVDMQQVYILPGRCTVQVCAKINLGLPRCANLCETFSLLRAFLFF